MAAQGAAPSGPVTVVPEAQRGGSQATPAAMRSILGPPIPRASRAGSG